MAGLFLQLGGTAASFPGTNGKIVFDSDRDGAREIYSINQDGTGLLRLTTNTAVDSVPSVSPDGTRIVFVSNRDGNNEIYVMNANGSGQTRLTTNGARDEDPVFSGDGTKIIFESNRDGDFNVYSMTASGGTPTALTDDAGFDSDPVASPDGTIAFSSDRAPGGPNDFDVYLMNADGSSETPLTLDATGDNFDPAFSPDGDEVLYTSNRDSGDLEIYKEPITGSGEVRLTTSPGNDGDAAFSPDGTRIAFETFRTGDNEIYVMTAAGGSAANATQNAASDVNPDWGVPAAVPPPGAKRPTATGVVCNYNFFNQRHTCFAQVADTGPSPPVIPTGTVTFATTEGGSFPLGTSCTLASSQTAPTIPSCSAEYIAPGGGKFAQVTATYEGDDAHDPSNGATAYMAAAFAPGCSVFQGCDGTRVSVKKALDLVKSLGPFSLGCGAPSASAALLGKLKLPAEVGQCVAGLSVLGSLAQEIQVKVGAAFSAVDFKALFADLPKPGTGGPKTLGQLLGDDLSRKLGGILRPVLESTPLGSLVGKLSDAVLSNPAFQKGVIGELFKEQFKDGIPPFPTPVAEDSAKKKKRAFVIASGKFEVASGTSRKVRLKLSKRARRFLLVLRRHGVGAVLKVNVQATLLRGGVPGAATGKKTVRVRLKPAKKKNR